MELYEREFLIYRIRAGYTICNINDQKILVYAPDKNILYLAQEVYLNGYQTAKDADVLDEKGVYDLLIKLDMWSEQKEKELEEILPKHIEYWKVELYNAFFQSNKQKTIRQYLAKAKEEQIRLSSIRHYFDHISCIGCASYAKNLFLISNSSKTIDGHLIDWNYVDINNVMNSYYSQSLSIDEMRMLARTSPWDTLWPLLKESGGSVFENSTLTSEQQSLLYWSIMYDRISESPDCPSDEIINDDDMLDGWLIVQKRKRDEERKKKDTESHLPSGKSMNADEVFLMAETIEDARKIEALNDPYAQQLKAQRFREIEQKGGVVREQDLTDVKRKQMMLANQAYIEKMRNSRRG